MTHSKDGKKFECPHCDKKFYQRSKLKRHAAKHSDVMSYECQIGDCKEKFKASWSLYKHKLKYHKTGEDFSCEICKKSFTDRYKLKRHSDLHLEGKTYECSICSAKFLTQSKLHYHKSKHKENEDQSKKKQRIVCDLCDESFATKDGLKKHQTTHSDRLTTSLSDHKKTHHSSETSQGEDLDKTEVPMEIFKCDLCEKTFPNRRSLTVHAIAHTDERPFSCNQCKKTYKTKKHLAEHERTHSDVKKHECNVCHKGFSEKTRLTRHMKSHLNDKYKYTCDTCSEKFKGKKQLNEHMKTHQEIDDDKLDEKYCPNGKNNEDEGDDLNSSMPIDQEQSLSSENFDVKADVSTGKQSSEQAAESKRNMRKSKYPRKVKIDFSKKH